MSEMVERVARAIYEAWAKAKGSDATWDDILQMCSLPGYTNAKVMRDLAFAEARAAIASMREPTDGMEVEGECWLALASDPHDDRVSPEDATNTARGVWTAMIDESLK